MSIHRAGIFDDEEDTLVYDVKFLLNSLFSASYLRITWTVTVYCVTFT